MAQMEREKNIGQGLEQNKRRLVVVNGDVEMEDEARGRSRPALERQETEDEGLGMGRETPSRSKPMLKRRETDDEGLGMDEEARGRSRSTSKRKRARFSSRSTERDGLMERSTSSHGSNLTLRLRLMSPPPSYREAVDIGEEEPRGRLRLRYDGKHKRIRTGSSKNSRHWTRDQTRHRRKSSESRTRDPEPGPPVNRFSPSPSPEFEIFPVRTSVGGRAPIDDERKPRRFSLESMDSAMFKFIPVNSKPAPAPQVYTDDPRYSGLPSHEDSSKVPDRCSHCHSDSEMEHGLQTCIRGPSCDIKLETEEQSKFAIDLDTCAKGYGLVNDPVLGSEDCANFRGATPESDFKPQSEEFQSHWCAVNKPNDLHMDVDNDTESSDDGTTTEVERTPTMAARALLPESRKPILPPEPSLQPVGQADLDEEPQELLLPPSILEPSETVPWTTVLERSSALQATLDPNHGQDQNATKELNDTCCIVNTARIPTPGLNVWSKCFPEEDILLKLSRGASEETYQAPTSTFNDMESLSNNSRLPSNSPTMHLWINGETRSSQVDDTSEDYAAVQDLIKKTGNTNFWEFCIEDIHCALCKKEMKDQRQRDCTHEVFTRLTSSQPIPCTSPIKHIKLRTSTSTRMDADILVAATNVLKQHLSQVEELEIHLYGSGSSMHKIPCEQMTRQEARRFVCAFWELEKLMVPHGRLVVRGLEAHANDVLMEMWWDVRRSWWVGGERSLVRRVVENTRAWMG